jgi:hypothetical protein
MVTDRSRTTTRMLRGSVAILACLLGCAALTGCSPAATPAPSPTSTAIFASEDEALAAATAVYQQYLAVSDQVSAEGGASADRLKPFLVDAYWPIEKSSVERLRINGVHTDGNSTFDSAELVKISDDMRLLTVRLCADVSNVRIVDSLGEEVTPPDRVNRLPLEVEFSAEMADSRSLLIARSEVWATSSNC